jgi:hypothetical protein
MKLVAILVLSRRVAAAAKVKLYSHLHQQRCNRQHAHAYP